MKRFWPGASAVWRVAGLACVAAGLGAQAMGAQELRVEMRPVKSTVVLGEPVWVNVSVTNESKAEMDVDFGVACMGPKPLKVEVAGADAAVPLTKITCDGGVGYNCAFGAMPRIAAGKTFTKRYLLDGSFQIAHSGEYAVKLEKLLRFHEVREGEPISMPSPQMESMTTRSNFTLTVTAADDGRLLAMEQEIARKIEADQPVPMQPGQHLPGTTLNARRKSMDDDYALAEGLARYPVAGMEGVFRGWIDRMPLETEGYDGLKRLNTAAARELLATLAETATVSGTVMQEGEREKALQALIDMGDRSSLPVMERLSDAGRYDSDMAMAIRNVAIDGLGLLGGESEIDRLAAIAGSGEPMENRTAAVRALGHTGSLKAVPVLMGLAGVEESQVLDTDYRALKTLTHLDFPNPDGRTGVEMAGVWRSYWAAQKRGARAYGAYECATAEKLP